MNKNESYKTRVRVVNLEGVAGTKFPLEVGDLVVSSTEGMEEEK